MRYLNWDVLLFPGSSRIPLQEFDTKCHVLPDQTLNNNSYLTEIESMSQIPVMTSFVSSLEQGSSFRVSVHSWEAPKPSQILQTFRTPGEKAAWEARVYIDGHMVAQRIFDDQAVWPEVIEATGDADAIHPKPIRFPVFHPDILNQAHWDAGEAFGRIRIVIAEGVTGQATNDMLRSTFDRLRDIVAFSFQHAPRHILEYSGIAWPNARLFRKAVRTLQSSIASRVAAVPDFEAHAHSPQRRATQDYPTRLIEPGSSALFTSCGRPKGATTIEDPFIGPTPISLRGKQSQIRTNSNDISMKDYNSIRTARSHAGTDMSEVSYQKPDFERAMNEAAIEEIVQALSPEKKHDLLQVLNPDQRLSNHSLEECTKNHLVAAALDKITKAQASTDSLLSAIPTSSRRGLWRGDLLTSRYSSVPLLTPSTMVPQDRGSSLGLRSSLDPLLPTRWHQGDVNNAESNLGQAKSSMELRPRSASNASKRKRQESPEISTPIKAFYIPDMLTSPCKRGAGTPIHSNNDSPAEGKASLKKQE